MSNNEEISEDENSFSIEKKLENKEIFILDIKKTESSKILINCESKDDSVTLYNYSIELSFEEFNSLGKCFKQCDNIDDIFIFLRNIIAKTTINTYNNELQSSFDLNILEDESLILILNIPLLSEKI